MYKALVAGGAGFIGSNLCESLIEKNCSVICLDNFVTGERINVEDLINNPNFRLAEFDITDSFENLKFDNLDFIFHLASPASPNKKSKRSYVNHPIATLLANSVGTYNLLNLARDLNAKFLYTSSSEIYGDPLVSPQNEGYFGNVNPNGIRSVYDEGKRFSEALTMAYVRKYDANARIVRIFNTYGPRMQADDGRVVSNFINQAISNKPLTIYGDGSQTRSFCYVSDMVDGLVKAMFLPQTKGEVFNLGNPDERTILSLAKVIEAMTVCSSGIVFEELPVGDPKSRNPDIGKAKKILNWEPKITVEDGLKKTIDYFRNLQK